MEEEAESPFVSVLGSQIYPMYADMTVLAGIRLSSLYFWSTASSVFFYLVHPRPVRLLGIPFIVKGLLVGRVFS